MSQLQEYRYWLFPALILLSAGIFASLPEAQQEIFRYQRSGLLNGEYWRAFTGHFTHLGWPHLLLNGAGIILIWVLYKSVFSPLTWLLIFVICALGISAGFYFRDTELETYVGLSGVLHGLMLAAVVVAGIDDYKNPDTSFPWDPFIVFVGLCGKITYEQFIGPVPMTQSASGGDVVVNAHLYGAVIGIAFGLVLSNKKKNQ